jgi:Tfp pilus assembly protein PilO
MDCFIKNNYKKIIIPLFIIEMKEILDIIKILVLLVGVYFIITLVMNDKTKSIQDKLDKIEANSNQIDSILISIDSIKGQRAQVINNIDKRTTVINQQKEDLKKPLPKDTNIHTAINFLHDFAK